MLISRKKILIFASLILLILIGFFVDINYGITSLVVEKINNENPEAKVVAYIQAVSIGDKEKALKFWEIHESYNLNSEYVDRIKNQGKKITEELMEKKIKPDFTIKNVEWWSTCCIPSVTENSRIAGKAKIYAQLADFNNIKSNYVFDVIVPGGYDGGLTGYSSRHWIISDVYVE